MNTIYQVKLKTLSLKIRDSGNVLEKIADPAGIASLARTIFEKLDDDQEHLVVFFLDVQNQVKGFKVLFSGGQDSCNVDTKLIFRNALLFGACSIILVHNHPSGSGNPSEEDKIMTLQVTEAGKILDIELRDHVIITASGHTSFVGLGLLG